MIDEETWREIVDDLPQLRELLAHRDQCVRETAAWPFAWLGGLDSLVDLLQAMHRGEVA